MHDYAHGKINLFECGININCFENVYCEMYIRLNTGVLSIRFNSIEEKSWFLDTLS